MRKLADALDGVLRLGVDTNPVIYFVQAKQPYFPVVEEVFRRTAEGEISLITSTLTLMESLVLPLRTSDAYLHQKFTDLLLNGKNVQTISFDAAIATCAADLRARHGLKPADTIQIATAIETGCDAFLTNDDHFNRVTEIRVLVVREMEV